jgi:hypothetical protein
MGACLSVGLLIALLAVGANSQAVKTPPATTQSEINQVISHVGEFVSPDGTCRATVKTSSLGGFMVLTFDTILGRRIDDVTGIAWVSPKSLVYTTSPTYGHPGVYTYDCESKRVKRLVAPRTLDEAYPQGADYFKLQGVSDGSRTTIFFYYVPDVDAMDAANVERPIHLFQVHLDGAGFRKAR